MGFEPHLTSLGGPGLGVLATSGSDDFVNTSEGDEKEGMTVPKRAALRDASGQAGHAKWAQGLGQWVY